MSRTLSKPDSRSRALTRRPLVADARNYRLDPAELVVELFAGAGGASIGLTSAYRATDIAINHDKTAIGVFRRNNPHTRCYKSDVFEVDPIVATGGRPVGVLWASPDCRHHSKAKGGKPRSKKIRGLAWVVVKWAATVRPRLIHLENVEEFADWGPLDASGQPCPLRKGLTFRRWVRQLENLGYQVEHRELVAADYGAPTIRNRLYVTARCDGLPIVWPQPSHSQDGRTGLPWRIAGECLDWDLPARSIFERSKPLAENSLRRIARSLWRDAVSTSSPFFAPTLVTGQSRVATLVKYYRDGGQFQRVDEPMHTVTTKARIGLVTATLSDPKDLTPAQIASASAIADLFRLHVTSRIEHQFVQVGGQVITDIGIRMITPREAARSQGFPEDFVIDTGADGERIALADQMKLVGNSVCPAVAHALAKANHPLHHDQLAA